MFYKVADGILCRLCSAAYPEVEGRKGKYIWVPVKVFKPSMLDKHLDSKKHEEGVRRFREQKASAIERSFRPMYTATDTNLKHRIRMVHFLCKEEVALSKVTSLHTLVSLSTADQTFAQFPYLSHESITDIMTCIAKRIRSQLLDAVHLSSFFSIMIDEATDVTNISQFITVIRFVGNDARPHNCFLDLRPLGLAGGTGEALEALLLTVFKEFGLDPKRFVGISTDGAAAMRGKEKGVVARLIAKFPWLLSEHCYNHRLALASQDAIQEPACLELRSAENLIDCLFSFFKASPARTAVLDATVRASGEVQLHLKRTCPTRWLSAEAAVRAVALNLPSIWETLRKFPSDPTAAGLLLQTTKVSFLVPLFVLRTVLPMLAQLSLQLQADSVTFSCADPAIDATKDLLTQSRDSNQAWNTLRAAWPKIEPVVGPLPDETEVEMKKLMSDYVKSLVSSLTDRFPPSPIISCFKIFALDEYPPSFRDAAAFGVPDLLNLISHFAAVLPETPLDPVLQWQLFRQLVKRNYPTATTPDQLCSLVVAKTTLGETYPTMVALAKIALTLSFSTASAERGFSAMDRVKTVFRNRLLEENLNSLLMISTNGPLQLDDVEAREICTLWRQAKVRRGAAERGFDPSVYDYPFPRIPPPEPPRSSSPISLTPHPKRPVSDESLTQPMGRLASLHPAPVLQKKKD
jgi:hypothetical protein